MDKEKLTKEEKLKILQDVFQDQASELRILKVEDILAEGKAQTFKDACNKIKAMEQEKRAKQEKSTFIAEQARELYDLFHDDARK